VIPTTTSTAIVTATKTVSVLSCNNTNSTNISVPAGFYTGPSYKPANITLVPGNQTTYDCLISSGKTLDSGLVVTTYTGVQYCCRTTGYVQNNICGRLSCGTFTSWGVTTYFVNSAGTCFTLCFAES
jgi:hypothetical protein